MADQREEYVNRIRDALQNRRGQEAKDIIDEAYCEHGYDIRVDREDFYDTYDRVITVDPPPNSGESSYSYRDTIDKTPYDGGEEGVPGTRDPIIKSPSQRDQSCDITDDPGEWDRTEDYERMREENRSTEQPEFPESPGETETPSDIPPEEPQPAEEPPPEEPPPEDKPKKEDKPKDAKDDCGYCVDKPKETWISSVPLVGDIYDGSQEALHLITHGIYEGDVLKVVLGGIKAADVYSDLVIVKGILKKLAKEGLKEAFKMYLEEAMDRIVEDYLREKGVPLSRDEALTLAIHSIIDQTNLSDDQKEDAKLVADVLFDLTKPVFDHVTSKPTSTNRSGSSVDSRSSAHSRAKRSADQTLKLMGIDRAQEAGTKELPINFETDIPNGPAAGAFGISS